MSLLEVKDVKYNVDGEDILRGMNLAVERGSVHALVGPNGAGKSTLAYTIMGLPEYSLQAGKIVFNGEDISGLSLTERAQRGISMAWQEPARFEGISVRDLMSSGIEDPDEGRLEKALESVALDPEDYLDRMVDQSLSGGERKRIEVASIVVMRPDLMILDEPDSGIDVEALEAIFKLLDTGGEGEITVLLVTHSKEVLAHADVATLMCCGKAVDSGPSEEIGQYFETRCIPCDIHNPDIVENK